MRARSYRIEPGWPCPTSPTVTTSLRGTLTSPRGEPAVGAPTATRVQDLELRRLVRLYSLCNSCCLYRFSGMPSTARLLQPPKEQAWCCFEGCGEWTQASLLWSPSQLAAPAPVRERPGLSRLPRGALLPSHHLPWVSRAPTPPPRPTVFCPANTLEHAGHQRYFRPRLVSLSY